MGRNERDANCALADCRTAWAVPQQPRLTWWRLVSLRDVCEVLAAIAAVVVALDLLGVV